MVSRRLTSSSDSVWEGEVWGELRLGMETELKKGRETGSPVSEPDLDLSLEISREKELLRNFGRLYFGDLDLDSGVASVFFGDLTEPLMMSSKASSTEDTLERWRDSFLQQK